VSSDERVGQYLANQRKLRRISLDELSERTRIPRRNLERLESGAFDSAADGFTRGFVRTVALALGLDADEAVMRLIGEPHADEERALRAVRRSALLRMGALLAIGLLALAGVTLLVLRLRGAEPAADAPVVYRRDAVRNLVEGEREAPAEGERVPPAEPTRSAPE
jgi:transcriptional regulator with XRE-family HTH domain